MSRVRFMSPYLKGGRDTAKLSNRARYIATRPGVEVLRGEHSEQPSAIAARFFSVMRRTQG